MKRYIRRRIALGLVTLGGVVVTVFLLTHVLPGSPAFARAGQYSSPTVVTAIKEQMGLNHPLGSQFISYIHGLGTLNLGVSSTTGNGVVSDLANRFPATAELAFWSLILAICLGVPLGILAGLRPGSFTDWVSRTFAVIATSLPLFWLGLVLLFIFFYKLGIAPSPDGRLSAFTEPPRTITGLYVVDSALTGNWSTLVDAAQHLVLPVVTLSLVVTAPILKIVRASTIDVMGSDYIRTAQTLGLSQWQIIRRDVLRNVGVQLLTTIGIVLGYLLSGSVLVEQVFSWPGIGRYALDAMHAGDNLAVQGFVLLVAVVYLVMNLVIDIVYGFIDPRIRLS